MTLGDKLRQMRLFADFTEGEMEEVGRASLEKFYPSGSVIIKEGTLGDGLYFVKSGTVVVSKRSGRGGEREALAELGPGEHFGEMALVDNHPTSAEVTAGSGAVCQFIPRAEYQKLMQSNKEIALKIYTYLARIFCERLRLTDEILLKEKTLRKKFAIEHMERLKED